MRPLCWNWKVTESLLFRRRRGLHHAYEATAGDRRAAFAIDDFGTRYTGLQSAQQLPLETMKIDQCFIRGIHLSPDLRALCNTIVAMARQNAFFAPLPKGIEEQGELEAMAAGGLRGRPGIFVSSTRSRRKSSSISCANGRREFPSFGFVSPCAPRDAEPLCAMA